jgi:hypothetical protein
LQQALNSFYDQDLRDEAITENAAVEGKNTYHGVFLYWRFPILTFSDSNVTALRPTYCPPGKTDLCRLVGDTDVELFAEGVSFSRTAQLKRSVVERGGLDGPDNRQLMQR